MSEEKRIEERVGSAGDAADAQKREGTRRRRRPNGERKPAQGAAQQSALPQGAVAANAGQTAPQTGAGTSLNVQQPAGENAPAKPPRRRRSRPQNAAGSVAEQSLPKETAVPVAETTEPAAPKAPRRRRRKSTGTGSGERKQPVRLIPLGGLGEIGKNMTVYESGGDMFIVDVGMTFPDDEMFGVDLVLPDFTFVEQNKDHIKGIVITHGHEDHIGGLPYLLKTCNLPVYATKLTVALIESKLKEHGLLGRVKLNVVRPGDMVRFGCMSVEFIAVNHSIPDACALAITTPAGVIVQTGDFKVDYTPVHGPVIDLARFGELGSKGVLCLLSDSTNAERPGFTESERTVGASFDTLFQKAGKKRIIVATFSSNVSRLQQIADTCVKYGRKLAVTGRSMINMTERATDLGYLNVPEDLLIDADQLGRYGDEDVVLACTGSQGEPMSALTRMAMGDHRKVSITANDFVILSASPIPGNEKTVTHVVDELLKLGAEVIYEKSYNVHVSGHASQNELKLMMGLTKPKFFIPVHGEFHHLKKHADLAITMGVNPKNILIGEIGHVMVLDGVDIKFDGTVPAGAVMVDGLGVGDVGSIVLRDRKHLAQDGLIIVVMSMDATTGQLLAGPDIVSRGFVYVREAEPMMNEARRVCRRALQDCSDKNIREWGNIKNAVKDQLGQYLYGRTKRSPMILPIIQEI